jgi:hypothetical protein
MNTPPWDDCKVAFGFNGDDDLVWEHWGCTGHSKHTLPEGWDLNETDSAGARLVVVFRVEGYPSKEDGERVLKLLEELK